MRERFQRLIGPELRSRPLLFAVGAVVGFIAIVGSQLHPTDPESRLPGSQRLAALIQRTQQENNQQKAQVQSLQEQIDKMRSASQNQQVGTVAENAKLAGVGLTAGTVGMAGVGFSVTLNDSLLTQSPTGNVNDLVIHSQDVQAVVNAMWATGAEAIAVNGERLVSTSAILCVGNTLLLNGSVFSPPYEITNVGADRAQFQDDPLVRQLRSDADRFSLQFSIGQPKNAEIPGYSGPTTPKYAQAVTS